MLKTVAELASLISGEVIGDPKIEISGITNIEAPAAGFITFAQDEKGLKILENSPISCIIVSSKISQSSKPLIRVPEPKLAWAKLLRHFYPVPSPAGTISDKSFISKSSKLASGVTVEPYAVVHDGAEIGEGAVIKSHASIGMKSKIGSATVIHPSVIIYENCLVGSRVIIHAGSVIGADGFGYIHTMQGQEKIPQVGNVIIEDDVEIGALVTVDRATVGSTVIGRGTKIDNLVQVGHNVLIGPHTVISAQTGISGSSKVGSHVTMGGRVGLGDHVEIGDWTMVGAGAGFPTGKKVGPKQVVFGQPARPYQEARKQIAAQLRSAETLEEVRKLRQRVTELEKAIAAKP